MSNGNYYRWLTDRLKQKEEGEQIKRLRSEEIRTPQGHVYCISWKSNIRTVKESQD